MSEKHSEQPYEVFLSYSHEDKSWVSKFVSVLKTSGVNAWSHADIFPGERWQEKIQEALRESNTLVMVLSPSSIINRRMFFELEAAVADKKRIIPVILEDLDISRIPAALLKFQALREESPQEAGKRVAKILEKNTMH
uniref:TIR domain-containing protein n=1 Tax=Candidatus Kentrum sp. TUN TaxID=2126343 RepID=A0A450ZGL9_9GAMM|nr:MAG: TIR domain-containing protein [Candidatus Kentron sp. TUN]VFK52962.1 MAG: TIR domain-containing protein [Candidatus Kentron sp. TUN]VFK57954.1 MAG: TIR domain-containing protein [Candidatus Kentron sp. TUN]